MLINSAATAHEIGYVYAIDFKSFHSFNKNNKIIILKQQKLAIIISIGCIDLPIPLMAALIHSKITYKK